MKTRLLALLALFIAVGANADTWTPAGGSSAVTPSSQRYSYSFVNGENGGSTPTQNQCRSMSIEFDNATGGAGTVEGCSDSGCTASVTIATLTDTMSPGPYTSAMPYLRINRDDPTAGTATVFIRCADNMARGGGSTSAAFSVITSGTNTAAAMVVGTGSSLDVSGTGTNAATLLKAVSGPDVQPISTATCAGGYFFDLDSGGAGDKDDGEACLDGPVKVYPGMYATLQAAINSCGAGNSVAAGGAAALDQGCLILVAPGTYAESFEIGGVTSATTQYGVTIQCLGAGYENSINENLASCTFTGDNTVNGTIATIDGAYYTTLKNVNLDGNENANAAKYGLAISPVGTMGTTYVRVESGVLDDFTVANGSAITVGDQANPGATSSSTDQVDFITLDDVLVRNSVQCYVQDSNQAVDNVLRHIHCLEFTTGPGIEIKQGEVKFRDSYLSPANATTTGIKFLGLATTGEIDAIIDGFTFEWDQDDGTFIDFGGTDIGTYRASTLRNIRFQPQMDATTRHVCVRWSRRGSLLLEGNNFESSDSAFDCELVLDNPSASAADKSTVTMVGNTVKWGTPALNPTFTITRTTSGGPIRLVRLDDGLQQFCFGAGSGATGCDALVGDATGLYLDANTDGVKDANEPYLAQAAELNAAETITGAWDFSGNLLTTTDIDESTLTVVPSATQALTGDSLVGFFAAGKTWAQLMTEFGISGTALDTSGNATFTSVTTTPIALPFIALEDLNSPDDVDDDNDAAYIEADMTDVTADSTDSKIEMRVQVADVVTEIVQIDGTGLTVVGTAAATTVTGANVTSGANPGHTHTTTSLSGIDMSDDTNLGVGLGLVESGDDVNINWSLTTAGDPALAVNQCVFYADGVITGGFLCEGTAANTNEQLYYFPSGDGADTATEISVAGHVHAAGDTTSGAFADARITGVDESNEIDDDVMPFDDNDSNFAATAVGPAIEEFDETNGAGLPNQADYKVNWDQIGNMPAVFADETDDGAGGATTIDALGDAVAPGAVGVVEHEQTWTWDTAATAGAFDALSLTITDDSTAGATTQRGLVVERNASTGTATVETLVQINNNDTDGTVTTGLEITAAAGTIATAIDASDADIVTALALGDNTVTVDSKTLSAAEIGVLDGAIDLATAEVTGILPTGNVATTLTGKTLTTATITDPDLDLKNAAAPTPTVDGRIEWEDDDDHIIVGDGAASQVEFVPTVDVTGPITMALTGATTLAATVGGRSATITSDVLDVDVELYTDSCDFAVEAPLTGDDGDIQCYFPLAATLTRIYCSTDTGTSVINFYERVEGTPNTGTTDMLTADLTCSTTGASTTSFADSALAADALLALSLQTTFTTGWVRVHAEFTIND